MLFLSNVKYVSIAIRYIWIQFLTTVEVMSSEIINVWIKCYSDNKYNWGCNVRVVYISTYITKKVLYFETLSYFPINTQSVKQEVVVYVMFGFYLLYSTTESPAKLLLYITFKLGRIYNIVSNATERHKSTSYLLMDTFALSNDKICWCPCRVHVIVEYRKIQLKIWFHNLEYVDRNDVSKLFIKRNQLHFNTNELEIIWSIYDKYEHTLDSTINIL